MAYYIKLNKGWKIFDERDLRPGDLLLTVDLNTWLNSTHFSATGPFANPKEAKYYILEKKCQELETQLMNEHNTERGSIKMRLSKLKQAQSKILNKYPYLFI